ncbi:hypothetical protein MNBD_GAMMA09-791 [hydrothermal vent metagenome]|uniref:J domain-containing protein n=1 Tax=hydrothermal vent metagenome TaxID=652676 RepID=A0A3B0XP03_9ZZZZ
MSFDNPLCLKILKILKTTDDALGLYELIKLLEADGGFEVAIKSAAPETDDYNLIMFRKNFIVMNALYQIQRDFSVSGYSLFISALSISILTDHADNEAGLIKADENQAGISGLSDYYLDWNNYHSASPDKVAALLNGFWTRYTEYTNKADSNDQRCDALLQLGLKSGANWEEIQSAYRQMIAINHPDKGGDSKRFIEIREAFLILKGIEN